MVDRVISLTSVAAIKFRFVPRDSIVSFRLVQSLSQLEINISDRSIMTVATWVVHCHQESAYS